MEPPFYCSHISPTDPPKVGWSVGCCDSCHDDEDYDPSTHALWENEWLHICCAQRRVLEDNGVNIDDRVAVAAFVETRIANA